MYCVKEASVGDYINIDSLPQQLVDLYSSLASHPSTNASVCPDSTTVYVSRRIRPGRNSRVYKRSRAHLKPCRHGCTYNILRGHGYLVKVNLLNSRNLTVLTTIGSQLTNLIPRSKKSPANILVIDHPDWTLAGSRMCDLMEKSNTRYATFRSEKTAHVDYDPRNSPFRIDISALFSGMASKEFLSIAPQRKV